MGRTRESCAGIARWAAGLSVLLPMIAGAEGAVSSLDCTTARVCDGAGVCSAGTGQVSFRMEPVETGADGRGRYTLRYADNEAAMEAVSVVGPFFWTLGTERDTLMASSETEFLWHRLLLDGAPAATITFLRCTFRQ